VRQIEVVAIVFGSMGLGVAFPDLQAVFSLTGGVCGSFLSFIFPGLFYMKACQGVAAQLLGGTLVLLGIVISVLSTVLVASGQN
jgi:hypothetical protein